ncbi:rab-GTPase-TBC domain-containing protein [Cristinia sonorae]|uniref:Rab-GTPase-TBC domain-containing protein n=1 Tax=Cristinia sonorae TaxID=1940300 RepID=A0A8K0XLP3_9AGAR|nr:rab-GTPase-TBC domain-containing protein [Cristinia sonorae]
MQSRRPPKSSIGGFPVELWDRIIDAIAADTVGWENGGDLLSCILVCKSWVHRCRYYLNPLRILDIHSAEELTTIARTVRSPPIRPRSVEGLKVEPIDEFDCQWIAAVPLCLPRFPNLRHITLSKVNFTEQHSRLPQLYSLFRASSLIVQRPLCISWSQITRFLSAVNPTSVHLTTRRYRDKRDPSLLYGVFIMRSQNLKTLNLRVSRNELAKPCRSWQFFTPQLEELELHIRRSEADDLQEDSDEDWCMLASICRLFQPSHELPALCNVTFFLSGCVYVKLLRDVKTVKRELYADFQYESSQSSSKLFSTLATFDPHEIKLEFFWNPLDSTSLWQHIDSTLSDRRSFRSLASLTFQYTFNTSEDLVQRKVCIASICRTWLPNCAERGIVPLECESPREDCPYHHHLCERWEQMFKVPLAVFTDHEAVEELLQDGVPPFIRHSVWWFLTGSTVKRMEPLLTPPLDAEILDVLTIIRRDVARLLRNHPRELEKSLLNMLCTYLVGAPDVKYCPGLLSVAGVVFLRSPDQENRACATFGSIMDTHLRPYFSVQSAHTKVEEISEMVATLLQRKDLALTKKLFITSGVAPVELCRPWFSNWFVDVLPEEHLLRVWDLALYYGVSFFASTAFTLLLLRRAALMGSGVRSQDDIIKILANPLKSFLPPHPNDFIHMVSTGDMFGGQ